MFQVYPNYRSLSTMFHLPPSSKPISYIEHNNDWKSGTNIINSNQIINFHFTALDGIIPPFPLKLSVTEDGLMTKTGLTISKNFLVELAHNLSYISSNY